MILTQEKAPPVAKITHGTVIDHIDPGKSLLIVRLLQLDQEMKTISMGLYLPSPTMGSKDILKIENRFLTREEASKIAVISPKAVINIIRDGTVVEKYPIEIPEEIEGFIFCPNPQCITHAEKIKEKFAVERCCDKVRLRCHWCEFPFFQEHNLEYKY